MPEGRLHLRILTPSREALAEQVEWVTLTSVEGELGVLPGHAPLLAALAPGPASARMGAEVRHFALGDGFLEVNDDVVTALVRSAEPAEEIDVARAERKRREREAELARVDLDERQQAMAEASLRKQLARLQVAERAGLRV